MKSKLLLCLLSLVSLTASATLIEPTTIEDGAFAKNTRWYTLQLGSNKYQIQSPGTAAYIALAQTDLTFEDEDLWCFVGDSVSGFYIYNKAEGVERVLVSPVTMSGTTGGTAYPTMQTLEGLDTSTYEALWKYETSTNISDNGGVVVYLEQYSTGYGANNRDKKLAFWTTGKDAGSSFAVHTGVSTFKVDCDHGALTYSSGAGTYKNLWTSSLTLPALYLRHSNNNMCAASDGTSIMLYDATNGVYTLSVDEGYVITDYSFAFTSSKAMTITPNGGSAVSCAANGSANVSVSDIDAQSCTFTLSGSGNITTSDFYVTIKRTISVDSTRRVVFDNANSSVPYRIPALAKCSNGDLLAISDYRNAKADIGYGRVSLRYKISSDNGATWGSEKALAKYSTSVSGNVWNFAFGDAAAVADRESGKVLVIAACGYKPYQSSTRTDPIRVARFYSEDNGQTWDSGEEITEDIYSLFDERTAGKVPSLFFSSGNILQSKYVKVGDYYRLYHAIPCRGAGTAVIYSDDFGQTWNVLGDVNNLPSATADESKCEEMPDGSVIVSVRVSGKRNFNIFTFTNSEKAEGTWSSEATGITGTNACDGESLTLPAVRNSDGKQVYVLLQTIPQNSQRQFVGFYYKEIADYSDYAGGTALAKDWVKALQVSTTTSCYSTMQLLPNDSIGFLYEENSYNGGYDIIYKQFTLDSITSGAYSLDTSFTDLTSYWDSGVEGRTDGLAAGNAVGMISSLEPVEEAKTAYESNKSQATMEAVWDAAVNQTEKVALEEGVKYYLRNKKFPTKYLKTDKSTLTAGTDTTRLSMWVFTKIEGTDYWRMKNDSVDYYVCATPATNVKISVSADEVDADSFQVVSSIEGYSYLACQHPTNASYPAIHHDNYNKIVCWTTGADASQWVIFPAYDQTVGINDIVADNQASTNAGKLFDLQGRRLPKPEQGIIVSERKKWLKP